MKVSIHGSGHCHHALTRSAATEIGSEINPRLDEWKIEWPGEHQVTRAYEVSLLESELTDWDNEPRVDSRALTLERGTVVRVQMLLVSPTGLLHEPEPYERLAHVVVQPDVALEVLAMVEPQAPDELARRFEGTEWVTAHEHPSPLSKQSEVAYGFYENADYARGAFEFRSSKPFG